MVTVAPALDLPELDVDFDLGFASAEPVRFRAADRDDVDFAGVALDFFAAEWREDLVLWLVAFF